MSMKNMSNPIGIQSSGVRAAILISGRGSNMASILEAYQEKRLTSGQIIRVLSNKADAPGLELAKSYGIPTSSFSMKSFPTREAFDEALLGVLEGDKIEWVILAGYNRIITPILLDAFPGRIVNIHPSLLPKFGGVGMVGDKVHQSVLDARETESGCTVHGVTAEVDGGPILAQARVPVYPNDTIETLSQRVLEEEHRLYPQTLQTLFMAHTPTEVTSEVS